MSYQCAVSNFVFCMEVPGWGSSVAIRGSSKYLIFQAPENLSRNPKLDFPTTLSDSPIFLENTNWYPLFERSKSNMMNLVCFRSNSQLVAWLRLCA